MRVLVLGGDGFCGWPTALHLKAHGFEVCIVDNLMRRSIDGALGTQSLTPIQGPGRRSAAADIRMVHFDCRSFKRMRDIIGLFGPDAIVHFAEQRAAPYSMKGASERNLTVENNVTATHNVLSAIAESGCDIHLVHLGTMGVYGYSGGDLLPEGYVDATIRGRTRRIVYPPDPGSIYHMTKVLDHQMFQTYAKLYGLRVTDLHQGIVWGTQTDETRADPDLVNRFDYDGDFGTVLNRFLVQAAVGYPLTVYGTGGQTRAFIHIRDTVRCIRAALTAPPDAGVRIVNQVTETHRVRDLAGKVSALTGAAIHAIDNPRMEKDENDLGVESCVGEFIDPVTLDDGLLEEVVEIAGRYRGRCDKSRIAPRSFWPGRGHLHAATAA